MYETIGQPVHVFGYFFPLQITLPISSEEGQFQRELNKMEGGLRITCLFLNTSEKLSSLLLSNTISKSFTSPFPTV
mgnify:CR=1 FL=1